VIGTLYTAACSIPVDQDIDLVEPLKKLHIPSLTTSLEALDWSAFSAVEVGAQTAETCMVHYLTDVRSLGLSGLYF
jgi:hypothetical protein